MLKDNIKNANIYCDLPERVRLGLEYIKNTDFSTIQDGRYEIFGNEVFAIIQNYLPKDLGEGKFEAHKKYIDIQYIIEGEEKIGVDNINNFTESTEYNQEKDIVFLSKKNDSPATFLDVCKNEFVILNPDDAHMPSITTNNRKNVKKAVVKVLV